MDDLEKRVLQAEMEIARLIDSVKDMYKSLTDMKSELHAIQKTLNQIKYFAMGGLMIYLGDTAGIMKLFMGVPI